MSLRRVRHAIPVAVALATAGLAACGDDGGARDGSTGRPARSEKILIKVHADLQDVVDKGEVLTGSSLGNAPFCQGGKFTGTHGSTAMISRTFDCPNGTLRIGFTPGKESGRTVSGRWKVLGGTGEFKGMKGSGRLLTRFAANDLEARETFRGSVVR